MTDEAARDEIAKITPCKDACKKEPVDEKSNRDESAGNSKEEPDNTTPDEIGVSSTES